MMPPGCASPSSHVTTALGWAGLGWAGWAGLGWSRVFALVFAAHRENRGAQAGHRRAPRTAGTRAAAGARAGVAGLVMTTLVPMTTAALHDTGHDGWCVEPLLTWTLHWRWRAAVTLPACLLFAVKLICRARGAAGWRPWWQRLQSSFGEHGN